MRWAALYSRPPILRGVSASQIRADHAANQARMNARYGLVVRHRRPVDDTTLINVLDDTWRSPPQIRARARERAFAVAQQDPPPGISPTATAVAIAEVLELIGDTCPECPPV